jgi:hypothetical protein
MWGCSMPRLREVALVSGAPRVRGDEYVHSYGEFFASTPFAYL